MELFVFWLLFGIASGVIASNKGRSGFGWFLLGVMFGPFALVVIAVLSSIEDPPTRVAAQVSSDSDIEKCPYCFGPIDPRATICRHCRSNLDSKRSLSPSVFDEGQPSVYKID